MDAANRWIESPLAYHGGGLTVARKLFPQAPENWLDLSTGINALAYPVGDLPPNVWTRLPEREAVAALEAEAGRFFGLGAGAGIVAAPGTQALIQLLPRLFSARRVAILNFTYAEHGRAWAASGAEVETVERLDDVSRADVAVVVNPNNPDGRLCAAADLLAVARKMAARGATLIVDEAFVDFLPQKQSLAPHLPLPGLVVLRSFGKTFGLAGLRLGFALGEVALTQRLRAAFGPWAVSGAAAELGRRAYADQDWVAAGAARLAKDCARLDAILRAAGFEILGGAPLFRLARHPQAPAIFARLCEGGILTRPFAGRPHWLRFGVPAWEEEFVRLERAVGTAGG